MSKEDLKLKHYVHFGKKATSLPGVMESPLRFSDIFEEYDSTSNAATWLQRTKVIAKMQDVELRVLFPDLLQSDAYAVYDDSGEQDKKDASKIEDALLQTYSLYTYTASELFSKRKMSDEERVDVFLTVLKRLACLARLPDKAVQLAFVVELPEAVSSRFRAAKETIYVMLPKVRAALNRKSPIESNTIASTTRRNVVRTKSTESIVCYSCRGLNYIATNCIARKKNVRCFKCEEMGHVAAKCTKQQENEEKRDRFALTRSRIPVD